MALPPFKPPPLIPQSAIVDPKSGVPTQFFLDWINEFASRLAVAINALNTSTDALTAAIASSVSQQAANVTQSQAVAQAQAAADSAGGGPEQSGDALLIAFNVPAGGAWVAGPLVNLAGVVAGNVSCINSGPSQISTTSCSLRGQFTAFYRIVEVVLGVDTVIFTGQFGIDRFQDDTVPPSDFVSLYNQTDSVTFAAARASAGAVSYRMDVSSPDVTLADIQLYLYARRS